MNRMDDCSVDIIVADPPYGMSYRSNHRKERYEAIAGDDSLEWVEPWAKESYRVLSEDSHMYVFCSFHKVDIFKQSIQRHFTVKNVLIWEKNNTSMGDLEGDYAPKYEMILFCAKGRRKLNGRRDSNILKYKRTGNKLHPTQKPEDLIRYLIIKSTNKEEIVYDPFMGSGTTAAASYNTERFYIGSEIDKKYYETSIERLDIIGRQGNLFA